MKLSEEVLKKIIAEEVQSTLKEIGWLDRMRAKRAASKKLKTSKKAAKTAAGIAKKAQAAGMGDIATRVRSQSTRAQTAAAGRATSAKLEKILKPHIDRLNRDLQKLGLDQEEEISKAMDILDLALRSASAKATGESLVEPEPSGGWSPRRAKAELQPGELRRRGRGRQQGYVGGAAAAMAEAKKPKAKKSKAKKEA